MCSSIRIALGLFFITLLVACGAGSENGEPSAGYPGSSHFENWKPSNTVPRITRSADGLEIESIDTPFFLSSPNNLVFNGSDVYAISLQLSALHLSNITIGWDDKESSGVGREAVILGKPHMAGLIKIPIKSDGAGHKYMIMTEGLQNWAGLKINRLALFFDASVGSVCKLQKLSLLTKKDFCVEEANQTSLMRLGAGVAMDSFLVPTPGEVTFPASVPQGGKFRFSVGTLGTSGSVSFTAYVSSGGESSKPRWETVFSLSEPAGDIWHDCEVDLSRFAGKSVAI
jgi:hypothetical protein